MLPSLQDVESQVQWWVPMGCDPQAWRPSPEETAGEGDKGSWAKNRNMVLRWEALDTALPEVRTAAAVLAGWLA
jgi:hypothetical protein